MTRTHGYLTAAGADACLQFLARTYPSICQLIRLPQPSVAGRICRALRIAGGGGPQRHGVLFVGGVEPPDVTPDLLVYFTLSVCQSYTAGSGCAFGARFYDAPIIRRVVDGLDVFVLPLLNPDTHLFDEIPSRASPRQKNDRGNLGHLRDAHPNIRSTYTVEAGPRSLPSHVEALYFIDQVSAQLLDYCIARLPESDLTAAVSTR